MEDSNMDISIHKVLVPIVNTIMEQDLIGYDSQNSEIDYEKDPWNIIYTALINIIENKVSRHILSDEHNLILNSYINNIE